MSKCGSCPIKDPNFGIDHDTECEGSLTKRECSEKLFDLIWELREKLIPTKDKHVNTGYIEMNYKGSYAETTVKSLPLEGLKYRKGYTLGAVDYHKAEGNQGQVKFFSDELELIDERIRQLEKQIR